MPENAKRDLLVDTFRKANWADHEAALGKWFQGALIPGLTIAWAAPEGADPVVGITADRAWEMKSAEAEKPEWSIVTSQTCDIGATGPGARHPFVQVSPVLRLDIVDEQKIQQIRQWRITDMAPVTGVPGSGVWVADLRISIPVSKGLFLAHEPIDAFANEHEHLRFAEHIAGKLRRPALHGALTEDLVAILSGLIKQGKKDPGWWESVEQVRLELTGGRLHPTDLRIHIISERTLTAAERGTAASLVDGGFVGQAA